ncbi:spindle pole body component 110-like [Nicotiana sylvestris]|uniref:spindle pole body component 110-like n=1 Tax=Nicotiana sylvestris TaxID=4096 RepID=UPI00388CC859
MNDFISCVQVSSGKFKDAREANVVKAGIPLQGGGSLANIFDGVSDSVGLDVPGIVRAAERFIRQCKDMYDHAFFWLREELSYLKKECEKLTSMLRDSEARSTQGGKELGNLRAALEGALREKADLAAQVKQNGSQINQLNTEISGLRKQSEVATEEFATSQDLLENARKEVAALAAAKSKVEKNASTYLEDAATTHKIARDLSIAFEQKLARAINHAKAEARRETLEEIRARGIDLLVDLEEAHELERELALLIAPDGGEDGSDEEQSPSHFASPLFSFCMKFIGRRTRYQGFFRNETVSSRGGGEIAASGSRIDDKRKDDPGCEGAYSGATHFHRLKRNDSVDPLPSEGGKPSDISLAFSEALHLARMAFDKLKSELLRSEALLREALDREQSLKILCVEKQSELVSLRREFENKAKELGQL